MWEAAVGKQVSRCSHQTKDPKDNIYQWTSNTSMMAARGISVPVGLLGLPWCKTRIPQNGSWISSILLARMQAPIICSKSWPTNHWQSRGHSLSIKKAGCKWLHKDWFIWMAPLDSNHPKWQIPYEWVYKFINSSFNKTWGLSAIDTTHRLLWSFGRCSIAGSKLLRTIREVLGLTISKTWLGCSHQVVLKWLESSVFSTTTGVITSPVGHR